MANECSADNNLTCVIKNFYYFVSTILKNSKSDGEWSIDCVKRGIGWASYCEYIAEEPSGAFVLNLYLKRNDLNEEYTLEDVRNFRRLLISNLLMNQLLPSETYKYVEKVSDEQFGKDEALKLRMEIVNRIDSYQEVIRGIRQNSDILNTFKISLLLETKCFSLGNDNPLSQLLKTPETLKIILHQAFDVSLKGNDSFLCSIGEWIFEEFNKKSMLLPLLLQFSCLSDFEINNLMKLYPGFSNQLFILIKSAGYILYSKARSKSELDQIKQWLFGIMTELLKLQSSNTDIQNFFVTCLKDEQSHFWFKILNDIK